jgi:uncharacterized protein (DUF1501 family)
MNDDLSRRAFLHQSALGLGGIAAFSLFGNDLLAGSDAANYKGVVRPLHHRPRAKHIIHLCMAGGPSHLELFDHKPELAKLDGKAMPKSFTEGQPIAQLQGRALRCLGPQHSFAQYGESGQTISSVLPHIAACADELAIVKSVYTDQINHDPAHTLFNTGTSFPGNPSMGSWVNYALGSACDNLPGYVVLTSEGGGQSQPIASRQWSSGFLSGRFQGVKFHSSGDPVSYVKSPAGVSDKQQNEIYDAVNAINQINNQDLKDPEIATRISQNELAAKMQLSVPDLMDTSKEPAHIKKLYGEGGFARNCLLARRLVERGVRFVQLYHRGWDHHREVKAGTTKTGKLCDQGTAALIQDLKQRGLLKDTLIIWGGEFGRTPMAQGSGRDHHIQGYSMFFCGGGIKGGMTYGATDELGYKAVENPVHVRDIHALLLHQLGIDHNKLTVKFQGLNQKLTSVHEVHMPTAIIA